ncbi:MAG TPA: hypothetical protein PLP25_03615, partial [Candidatus Limiplasma sp.]|nr:hypothetical protein [Candidatus Limiplasma sp.]
MKKVLSGLLVLLTMLSLWLVAACAENSNLLNNGGFEQVSVSGEPDGWYTSAYRTQEGYTRFEITDEKAHTGRYSAKITNANANDARYVYSLSVKPETMYRFSGYVLVEEMGEAGNGANLSIEDVYSFSERVFDTQGEWKYIEWYGETQPGQTDVQLDARIGGYGAESQGIAYFDDLSVVEVTTLPAGVTASLWYNVDTGNADSASGDDAADSSKTKSTLLFTLLACAFMVLVALGVRGLLPETGLKPKHNRFVLFAFAAGLLVAFAIRLYLGGAVQGYSVDMNCFSAWSLRMASEGPWGFYSPDVFCDYPPGYMLLLWPVGLLIRAVGYADSPMIRLIVKSIPILCDMGVAIALFAYAKKRLPIKAAVFVALFFALNPAVLVNGAAWGQVDTVLGMLMLFTAMAAMENRWRAALPLFVTAVLMKPQALLFAPVGLIWLVMALVTDRQNRKAQWRQVWQGLLIALGCALALVAPFAVNQSDPAWLLTLYQKTLSSYNYAALNTANLMYLLGGNWSPLSSDGSVQIVTLSWWVPAVTGTLLMVFGFFAAKLQQGVGAVKTRLRGLRAPETADEGATSDRRRLPLGLLCLLFGVGFAVSAAFPCTFISYGTCWMVFAYLFALVGMIADRRADALPFYLALMLIGVYVTGVKIHERYLFAALALLPLAYIRTRDRRLLWLCAGFSVTTFLNTAIVLDNSILFGASMGHLNSDTLALNDTLCIINLFLYIAAGWIAVTGLKPSENLSTETRKTAWTNACYRDALLEPRDARLHLTLKDYAIIGITMALYACLTFTNLGSTKAPQTAWVATSESEQVVLKLDREQTFKTLYYAGVSYNNFSISVSSDGVNWSDAYPCEMREGLCYRWNYAITSVDQGEGSVKFNDNNPDNILWLTGRYLRINAESAGLNLWEVILRDQNGNQIPVTLTEHTGAKNVLETGKPAENLI